MELSGFVCTYYLNERYQSNFENYVKAANELSAYIHFDITENIILKTKLGYSIGRNYRVYDIQERVTWRLSAFRFNDK